MFRTLAETTATGGVMGIAEGLGAEVTTEETLEYIHSQPQFTHESESEPEPSFLEKYGMLIVIGITLLVILILK